MTEPDYIGAAYRTGVRDAVGAVRQYLHEVGGQTLSKQAMADWLPLLSAALEPDGAGVPVPPRRGEQEG